MTFQKMPIPRKKIAIIGGGISGLGAAYALSKTYQVTLYEAENRLGGHARTILSGKNGQQPVDTGFIVFNYPNYPELSQLFAELNVPVAKSDMSFGASLKNGKIEYALRNFDAIFAQRKNVLNPQFMKMVWDINRFNTIGLTVADDESLTIGQFLKRLKTGDWFRDYYLLPLSGAIWSTPTEKILDFPAYAMLQFFKNHALLSRSGQHQWYTVKGGSREYVSRLENALVQNQVEIRLNTPVASVTRHTANIVIKTYSSEPQTFDEVVFATHSDDTLAILSDPSKMEERSLASIKYQNNDVVLHADVSVMPKLYKCWSSWVYTEREDKSTDKIDLTYWMNSLQPIPLNDPLFVTLNSTRNIDQNKIYDQVTMRHPVYDLGVLSAQKDISMNNGQNRTWFSGAWMKNGFHEDGLSSGLDVARSILAKHVLPVAAE
ncbi:MAG: FAD-dependent oxidoreductase [Rhodobacteraceae bacterium]|jgi:predicted NAD/FAD-binding protein|nr:MAG: FAD-dependent oxidoreductase [Paracoccaceae bacterium]